MGQRSAFYPVISACDEDDFVCHLAEQSWKITLID